MERLVLLGAGGHGRDILDAARSQGRSVIGFIDENSAIHGTFVNGIRILGGLEWLLENGDVQVIISVGNPVAKKRFAEFLDSHNIRTAMPIIHPNAYISKDAQIGEGTVILAGSVIQPQVKVGNHVYVSTLSTLGHDVIIKDFASLHPGVQIGGETVIEFGCFIGMGVKILPRVKIGAWATVGAGAVVINDVPANVTVVGMPARVVEKKS